MPPRVLMYHGFGRRSVAADPHSLFVPFEDFDAQLSMLRRFLRPLDLSAYIAGRRGGRARRSFLLTIDDGYVSTFEDAGPRLARAGIPAVLFVCPARLGGTSAWMDDMPGERLMTVEQVRAIRDFGVEIGAHGLDHTRLPGLPATELRRQVAGAREAIADLTGEAPRAFAYPEGLWDEAARRAVREAGYEAGFSVHDPGGRFAIPRVPVTPRDASVTFGAKLLPGYRGIERAVRAKPVRRAAARLLGQRARGGD